MPFDKRKKDVLGRADKSNKGNVDRYVKPLVNTINKLSDYYTTSSCAGRIRLFAEPVSGRKCDGSTLYLSHVSVKKKETGSLWKKIISFAKNNKKDSLWMKQEPLILHVACRNLNTAQEMLNKAKSAGFKRSGIISTNKNPVVEIIGSEKMETILVKKGAVLIDKSYVSVLLEEANKRFLANMKRVKELRNKVS